MFTFHISYTLEYLILLTTLDQTHTLLILASLCPVLGSV